MTKRGGDGERRDHVRKWKAWRHCPWLQRERDVGDGNKLKFSKTATISPANGSIGGDGSKILRGEAAEDSVQASGTSIFDPVLCELAYLWFSPPGGHVLDPFAGGSVRGIVASRLGRKYTGVDLRAEQIDANEKQAADICTPPMPRWIVGDSTNVKTLAAGEYDLVFSCPPYGDLEKYSDNPADLSTMDFDAFVEAYRKIIAESVGLLRDNRFACFVVGDFRDKKGFYRNFPGETIRAFEDAGATLYNEAILVTSVGSLPIRVGKQFTTARKLGKTHQNVLVFCKGDPRKAANGCGPVEVRCDLETTEFGEKITAEDLA